MTERRLSKRAKVELPASLHGPGATHLGVTGDVSCHGLFIVTSHQKNPGELVQFWLKLPDNIWIQMLAIVSRSTETGFGLRIHMIGAKEKGKWDRLINELLPSTDQEQEQERTSSKPSDGSLPRFLVRPRTLEHLHRFARKELSAGGMFLRTPLPQATGTKVELLIVHPVTDVSFPVIAHVVLAHSDGPLSERGNGLTFETEPKTLISEFKDYIETQASA